MQCRPPAFLISPTCSQIARNSRGLAQPWSLSEKRAQAWVASMGVQLASPAALRRLALRATTMSEHLTSCE